MHVPAQGENKVDQSLDVDWDRWERRERPKLPMVIAIIIVAGGFSLGALFQSPAISTLLGILSGVIAMLVYWKLLKKIQD